MADRKKTSNNSSRLLDDAARLQRGNFTSFGDSVLRLPAQIQQAWRETRRLKLPAGYRRTTTAVACGMGGSALGPDVLQAVLGNQLRRPLSLVRDYTLPGFVGPHTLAIVSSYSGGTEESLATLNAARKRRAKIAVVSGGGALAAAARRFRLPHYIFTPTHNPSRQPRLGLGYLLVGPWVILAKAGVLPPAGPGLAGFLAGVTGAAPRFGPTSPTARNPAKKLALALYGKIPLMVSGGSLVGNTHIFANQCHESAKQLTLFYPLPELNHHLLEGLRYPAAARAIVGVFWESPNDPPRIRRRLQITRQVFSRQGLPTFRYRTRAASPIAQAGEVLQLGSFTSWYLAVLNGVNPQAIPWVDFLKSQLKKS